MPNAVLAIVAGAVLGILVYVVISMLGTMLFRRTGQHDSFIVRIIYGSTGALLGVFFGLFFVWLIVIGVRALGTVADAQVREQTVVPSGNGQARTLHAVDVRRGLLSESNEQSTTSLTTTLSRLKNSLELGPFGRIVKKNDIVSNQAYETLGKVGTMVSDPERVQRFLSFPGAQDLVEHPKVVALRNDAQIQEMIAQGRYLDLLQNQKILDAANDPEVGQEVRYFKFQEALDYALKKE
jgi:hypothetical protein